MMNNTDSTSKQKQFHSSLFDTVKVKVKVRHGSLFELRKKHPKRILWKDRHYSVRGRFRGCYAIVASAESGEVLHIEASIPRFLTGQNVVGTENLKQSSIELIDQVLRRMRITPTPAERRAYQAGEFEYLRVDYANHVWCAGERQAQAFVTALRQQAAGSALDYSAYRDQTVYWRQHSTRSSVKAYVKGAQIRRRPLGPRVKWAKFLALNAERMVRFELTLRADELARLGLRTPRDWTPGKARELLNAAVQKVVTVDGKVPSAQGMELLSKSLRDRLELWMRGASDAFTRYPGALASNKRDILQATGIDISSVRTPEEQAKDFVTLKQIFESGWHFKSWESRWEALKQGVVGE